MSVTQDTDEERLDGSSYVTGFDEDQLAYRSEFAGTTGVLTTVAVLVKHFHITTGVITIALDGESASDEASGDWSLQIDQPCFDYFQKNRNRVKALPIEVKWQWLKGHRKEKDVRILAKKSERMHNRRDRTNL